MQALLEYEKHKRQTGDIQRALGSLTQCTTAVKEVESLYFYFLIWFLDVPIIFFITKFISFLILLPTQKSSFVALMNHQNITVLAELYARDLSFVLLSDYFLCSGK